MATRTSTPFCSARTCGPADAAVDDGVTQAGELAVGLEALADLRGQLARRGEDQRPNRPTIGSRKRIAATCRSGRCCFCCWRGAVGQRRADAGAQAVQRRQRERGRLAGAGLGAAHQVAARRAPAESPAVGSASPCRSPRRERRGAAIRRGRVDQKLSRNVSIFPIKGICRAADATLTQRTASQRELRIGSTAEHQQEPAGARKSVAVVSKRYRGEFLKGPRWPLQSNLNEPARQMPDAGLAPKLLAQG